MEAPGFQDPVGPEIRKNGYDTYFLGPKNFFEKSFVDYAKFQKGSMWLQNRGSKEKRQKHALSKHTFGLKN